MSSSHPAAVNHEDMTVEVIARGGGEKNSRAGYVLWPTPAPGRDAFEDLSIAGLIRTQRSGILCLDIAGSDRVHTDTACGPFVRKGLCETRNTRFCCSISRNRYTALE